MARLRDQASTHAPMSLKAFYSSVFQGIVTDTTLAMVPMDDHMVHRGHSVFDTCIVHNARAYQLDHHLDRLLLSAQRAGITTTLPREHLRKVILATAAAAGMESAMLRYWLSVGRGGFGCSPAECQAGGSQFYCVVLELPAAETGKYECGIKVITTQVPIKPSVYATVKSTNYLPNAMMTGEAEKEGATQVTESEAKNINYHLNLCN